MYYNMYSIKYIYIHTIYIYIYIYIYKSSKLQNISGLNLQNMTLKLTEVLP